MLSILKIRCQVQIAYQKVKLSEIYLTPVVEPDTNLCLVLLKHIVPPKIVNIYLQIDSQSIGSNA